MRGTAIFVTASALLGFAPPGGEQCVAWAREQTGADRARFGRAYDACLSSLGYTTPTTDGNDYVTVPPSVLVVGRPVAFKPAALPVSVICDDLSVVRVDDAGTFLWLSGLKPGETSCSFGAAQRAGRRAVYHFVVRAEGS